MTLCRINACRKIEGHRGQHDIYPSAPWAFLTSKDKDKLSKAGFATPRGGAKGAYQNHVLRSNKVIVPFERLGQAPWRAIRMVTLFDYSLTNILTALVR